MIKILLILFSFTFLACSDMDGDLKAEKNARETKTIEITAEAIAAKVKTETKALLGGAELNKVALTEYNICDRTDTIQAMIVSQLIKIDAATAPVENEVAVVETAEIITCENTTKKQLASITELNLQGTKLTSLKNGDFSNLTGLKNLDLSNNKITTLPKELFYGLTNLNRINLSNNQLTDFPITTFNKWKSIKTTANNSIINNLPNLKFIDLRNNKLSDDFKDELKEEIKKDRFKNYTWLFWNLKLPFFLKL